MKTPVGRIVLPLLLLPLALAPLDAQAQVGPEDRAAAESLFQQGRKLMEEKRFADACRKLEESHRLDPAPGTLLNLADCHHKEGRVATSWAEFHEVAAMARRDGREDRENIAKQRIEELTPLLPKLIITVPAEARVPGLVVSKNGTPLRAGAWGTEIPIDPGEVLIEAAAPDFEPWKKTETVAIKGTLRVTIPALVAAPKPPPGASAPVSPTGGAAPTGAPVATSNSTKTVGIVLGAVGLASIGVGSYFGLRAMSKRSDSDKECPTINGTERCSQSGADLNDQAKTAAWVSNITVGAGAALLLTGTVLYFTASPSNTSSASQPRPRVGLGMAPLPGGGFATLQSTW